MRIIGTCAKSCGIPIGNNMRRGRWLERSDSLQDNPTPVVICEAELPDGTWKDVLAQFALIKCPPILVVSARLADEKLWSEVLRLGGYNVLVKPLNMQEVSRVVSFSWLLWKNLWDRPLPYARSVQCGAL